MSYRGIENVVHFRNIHMPMYDFAIKSIDRPNNKVSVYIKPWDPKLFPWTEDDWNLQHTEWAFEKGEYYPVEL